MIKLLVCSALAAASLVAYFQSPSVASTSPADPMADLSWLAGEWRGKAGDADVVSWHSDPAGGMIVMATKELEGGKVSLFDFGVVSRRGDAIAYVPYPYGKASVAFPLVDFDPKVEKAVFANESHDFPKRFVFERASDGRLRIELAGDEKGQPMTVEYELRLVGPAKR